MKKIKILLSTISFLTIFVVLVSCQNGNRAPTSITDESMQDYNKLFQMELHSDKQTYKTTDEIKIWATLKYIGTNDQIRIWHGEPYISFYISDGKNLNIGGIVNTVLTSTILEKGKLYKFDYAKNGGYSNDDPNADFLKKFYEGKNLFLPVGNYIIKAGGAFSLTENPTKNPNTLSKELKIQVVQ